MNDPDAEADPDETEFRLDAVLGRFKHRTPDADTPSVSDKARAGMTWNPVTDSAGGGSATTEPPPPTSSSFQFDLGSALARLGSLKSDPAEPDAPGTGAADTVPAAATPAATTTASTTAAATGTDPLPVRDRRPATDEPADPSPADPLPTRSAPRPADDVEPLPVRSRQPGPAGAPIAPPEPLPTRTPASTDAIDTPPIVDRLPTRTSRTDPASTDPADPRRSVFADANPTPTLPTSSTPRAAAPSAPPAPTPLPTGAVPFLPTLPVSAPSAPPPMVAPIETAPSTPDLNALRSAQLRASRNDRRGKLVGRSLLALVVLGGVVGAAMVFGRSYLFPDEWNAELTPLVDEIQQARGVEFDAALPLVEEPATDYAPRVTTAVLGPDWSARLAEWRALGLAGGDGAVDDVEARVAALYPAFFDPETDQLVASAERSADDRAAALRLALEDALAHQLAGDDLPPAGELGLTGLDPTDAVARRAYDAAAAGLVADAPDALDDLADVPLPVAYRLRSVDALGPLLIADVETPRPADPLPATAAGLADGATPAGGALLQPGDRQVGDPVALGPDGWALIWATRLPPATVDAMADSIESDSYTAVERAGVTCAVAVLETASDVDAAALTTNLTTWSAASPAGAGTVVAQLTPTRVQLETCDPGAEVAVAVRADAVDVVLSRQIARLR